MPAKQSTLPKANNMAPISTATVQGTAKVRKATDGKDYIRNMSRHDRNLLTQGPLVKVVNHAGHDIIEIPCALLKAASTKDDLVVDDKVVIPEYIDTAQVKRLVSDMVLVARSSYVADLPKTDKTYDDVMYHSAAEELGMQAFTQSIFDIYFKRAITIVAAPPAIEALDAVKTPSGEKLYKQMAYKLATAYYEHQIEDRGNFENYLSSKPRLSAAVAEVVDRLEAKVEAAAHKALRHAEYLERQSMREEHAERKAENLAYKEAKIAEKEYYQERQEHEKAVRKSMLEKKREGKKLNAEEARMHLKHFGKPAIF